MVPLRFRNAIGVRRIQPSRYLFRMLVMLAWVLLPGLLQAVPAAADGPIFRKGVNADVDFQISVPTNWNGGLVLFAHGYQGEGSGRGTVIEPPIAQHLTQQGYAWATSGYRAKGYRPDWFLEDILTIRQQFIAEFGMPRWTIVYGQSMGGDVAVATLELHPTTFQGGLVECGVVDGVGLMDWYYAYTAAAEYFSGVRLLDVARIDASLVNGKWLPAMGTPGAFTERGRLFDNVVKHLAGGDVALRLEGLSHHYTSNLYSRDPGPGGAREFARHADTTQYRYEIDPGMGIDAATINREIRRVTPAPNARSHAPNAVFAERTGRISVPLLTLHETADFRVPFRLEQDYRRRTLAVGTDRFLVQRVVQGIGHCAIDNRIRERAFDDLVTWIERGNKPAGDDILFNVPSLGQRWLP